MEQTQEALRHREGAYKELEEKLQQLQKYLDDKEASLVADTAETKAAIQKLTEERDAEVMRMEELVKQLKEVEEEASEIKSVCKERLSSTEEDWKSRMLEVMEKAEEHRLSMISDHQSEMSTARELQAETAHKLEELQSAHQQQMQELEDILLQLEDSKKTGVRTREQNGCSYSSP
jgi:chromosome segregation ATPase